MSLVTIAIGAAPPAARATAPRAPVPRSASTPIPALLLRVGTAIAPLVPAPIAAAYTDEDSLGLWRPPDGSNPLEGLTAGPSPIPFVNGDLTGYWFLDVFAYMNLVLIVALLGASMRGIEDDGRGGSTGEGPLGGMRASAEEEEDQPRS